MSVNTDTTSPVMLKLSKAEIPGALIEEPLEVHKVTALRCHGPYVMGSSFNRPAESKLGKSCEKRRKWSIDVLLSFAQLVLKTPGTLPCKTSTTEQAIAFVPLPVCMCLAFCVRVIEMNGTVNHCAKFKLTTVSTELNRELLQKRSRKGLRM